MNKLTITSTVQLRQALEQFYAATATPEVTEALTDYFRSHTQVEAEFEADRAIILAIADAASIEEPDDMEQRILNATCGSPRRPMWQHINMWHVAAAAVTVFAVASLWLFRPNSDAVADTTIIAKADTVTTIQPQPVEEPRQQPEPQTQPEVRQPQPAPAAPNSRTRVVTDPNEAAQILASTLKHARRTIAQAKQSPSAMDPALNSINNSLNSIQQ
ncbi:MAG: hypothetical protein ACI391_09210 [Muribaculaceae bacterium]